MMKMNFGVTRKKQDELEARMAVLGVREADIEEKYIRSSGPGGQKVNKTASCVYLKHIQSGNPDSRLDITPMTNYAERKNLL